MMMNKSNDLIFKAIDLERMHKNLCIKCGTPLVNAYDNILGRVSEYVWKYECDCFDKNIRLCKG